MIIYYLFLFFGIPIIWTTLFFLLDSILHNAEIPLISTNSWLIPSIVCLVIAYIFIKKILFIHQSSPAPQKITNLRKLAYVLMIPWVISIITLIASFNTLRSNEPWSAFYTLPISFIVAIILLITIIILLSKSRSPRIDQ